MRTPRGLLPLLGFLVLLPVARADQAVVVGINEYQDPGPRKLRAAEVDALDMAQFCRNAHYDLPDSHFLLGKRATKAAILQALADLKGVRPDERVLFYFAGHGTQAPNASVLPYDYSDVKPTESALGVDELYRAMRQIPTKANRTVILDSCFSAAMSRAVSESDLQFTSRCYERAVSRDVTPDLPDDTQSRLPQAATDGDKICYLTAAKGNESALETQIDGKPHGLFTHALIPQLRTAETCGLTSAAVETAITQTIRSKGSSLKQTPSVTDAYRDLVVLSGAPGGPPPPPPAPPKAVWDLIARERPDSAKLSITIEPGRSDLLVGQAARLKVKVGAPGYLVVLWNQEAIEVVRPLKDLNGRYQPVRVEPNEYAIGPEKGQYFTHAGGNRITALLFESPDAAQKLLDTFASANPTLAQLQQPGLADVDDGSKGYVSAGLTLAVGNEILGRYRIADPKGLFAALSQGGYLDTLENDVPGAFLKELRADGAPTSKEFPDVLACAVNAALATLARKHEVFVAPDAPGLTPEAMRWVQETQAKLKTEAVQEQAILLNAALLAKLFPKLIVEAKR